MSMMHSCVFMCASMFMLACFNTYVKCLCGYSYIHVNLYVNICMSVHYMCAVCVFVFSCMCVLCTPVWSDMLLSLQVRTRNDKGEGCNCNL